MSLDQYQQEVDREEKQSRTFAGQGESLAARARRRLRACPRGPWRHAMLTVCLPSGFKLGETADAPAEVVGRPLQEELAKRPKMRKVAAADRRATRPYGQSTSHTPIRRHSDQGDVLEGRQLFHR